MKIKVKNIKVETIIGINDDERINIQPLSIDIQISYDSKQASETDDINHTVDYYDLTNKIITYTQNSSFNLIETLAERLLDLIFENEKIKKANIEIRKPKALKGIGDYSAVIQKRKR